MDFTFDHQIASVGLIKVLSISELHYLNDYKNKKVEIHFRLLTDVMRGGQLYLSWSFYTP